MSVIERISKIIALSSGATNVDTQRRTQIELPPQVIEAIYRHTSELREGTRTPNWEADLQAITDIPRGGNATHRRVISDLAFERDGHSYYFSIKTVKPDLDQTEEAKRNLLLLKTFNQDSSVYFGLYYNPYGEQRDQYAWQFPMKIFDMHHDECVLIGRDYWDIIGGQGTYDEILTIATRAGETTRPIIEGYGLR
jgi:hypothetical protein